MRERDIQRLKKRLEREGGGKREEGGAGGAGGVKLKAGTLIE
jgi:nanoRNase/pAp phosphatase (c-di-AMP/oligoRNAs hydrolase)